MAQFIHRSGQVIPRLGEVVHQFIHKQLAATYHHRGSYCTGPARMVASSFPSIIGRQRAGWRLARDPHEITLLEVYDAVEQEPLFAMYHSKPNLACPVGHGIRPVLGELYGRIDATVRVVLGLAHRSRTYCAQRW